MPEYCVTGGSGFIATYLIKSLLQNGHIVRTTVRDPGTYKYIIHTYIHIYICWVQLLCLVGK